MRALSQVLRVSVGDGGSPRETLSLPAADSRCSYNGRIVQRLSGDASISADASPASSERFPRDPKGSAARNRTPWSYGPGESAGYAAGDGYRQRQHKMRGTVRFDDPAAPRVFLALHSRRRLRLPQWAWRPSQSAYRKASGACGACARNRWRVRSAALTTFAAPALKPRLGDRDATR